MIFLTQNGDGGVLHCKKSWAGKPENDSRTYRVARCGPLWEVRCLTRSNARVTADQLVATCESEQEADALACRLANPEQARNRGKRMLEELIEDDYAG